MREKIGLHCDVISGYAFKTNDWKTEGIPVIKIGNISNGSDVIIDETTQYVDESFLLSLNKKFVVDNGDILISLTGSHINQPNSMVGRTCRNFSGNVYLLNQRAGKVIPFANTDKQYLYYLLSTTAIKYDIANRAYGGANQVNVSPTDIKNIRWDFPSKETQTQIADVLSKYDELIEVNNQRIKKLELTAEELYKEWFVRLRFPNWQNTEFENGIPKGWIVTKTKAIVKRLPFGVLYKTEDTEKEGNVIVIDQSQDEYVGFHNNEPSYIATTESPIIIFGDHSCKFRLMNFPFSLSENVIPFISNSEIPTYYLFFAMHNLIETTEYKRHWSELMSKKILVPPIEVLTAFADKAKLHFSLIEQIKVHNRNLIKQRDLLLPRLMSGKLEV